MDQASLRLDGKFLSAFLNGLNLFRSSLNDTDLKTATGPDIAQLKLTKFSEFRISSVGKVLSLSRFPATTACARPNFRCNVAKVSLYITPLELNFAISLFAFPGTSVF